MSAPYLRSEAWDMDILTDYRITALIPSQAELSRRAEWARVALERETEASPAAPRSELATGSLTCVPVTH